MTRHARRSLAFPRVPYVRLRHGPATARRAARTLLTALSAVLPMAMLISAALAFPAPAQLAVAQASPIQHVVLIYLENHTFDSVLGFWCDQHPGRCPDGGMPAQVRLEDGTLVTPTVTPDKVPGLPHNVGSQVTDMDGGAMDGWAKEPACDQATGFKCISGYEPQHLPNITALADSMAISDMTFSENNSPSWGGHLDAVAATLDQFTGDIPAKNKAGLPIGPGWGCDSNRIARWGPQGKFEPSCIPCPALTCPGLANGGAFRPTPVQNVPTIMDRLDAAGLPWKIYGTPTADAVGGQQGGNTGGYGWSICPSFASCLDTSQDDSLVPSAAFQADASSGSLPAFSVVTPGTGTFTDSCHNLMSMTACDNWVGSLVSSVESGPDWSSTAVFITWDDMGGFYDQVPPPPGLNADGTQAGPRMPLLIVSPYVKPGYTDTTPTTFAGVLAFTEHTFGLAPLSVNDAGAYDFSGAFDFTQRPRPPVRMVHRRLPLWARHLHLTKAMLDDPT